MPPEGGVRVLRFLAVAGTSTLGALGVLAGIVLGWISVAFATTQPIDIQTSAGTADSVYLSPSRDVDITGIDSVSEPRSAGLVRVHGSVLADLCLIPRVELPIIGGIGSLRITSSRPVGLSDVSLAATEGNLAGLDLPATVVGRADGPAGSPGGFALSSEGDGDVRLGPSALQAYGLVLHDGISLRSLTLRPGLRGLEC